ncbi:S1-like domain-containing RNA-binding protein [Ignatzschineria rhizosphaerae]|uniref:S1-like domain-containing RNA-binding protein n=1 Tax=Ignatzschineria rhizosphaerae TaxID=2923279 RepID=A0ABY3WYS2_9GAMM|nr:S1-like domain-containing RNA-binding protein [Ignatzschineria rhizosphaerae]UNM95768.1 S1-like domain-containing RNA-binding protein [Ignatzschineria rhizosphaerae]
MSYYNENDPKIGQMNRLTIIQKTKMGLILEGDVLLPHREIPKDQPTAVGKWLDVFVYLDNHNHLIASPKKPYTEVGKFADLQVVEINDIGIFFDWGLSKDLLLPFSEEVGSVNAGDFAIVYTYIDEVSERITASMKLEKFLDQAPHHYTEGDPVQLIVESKTDLGVKVIVDHQFWGLMYHSDVISELEVGDEILGYVKHVREDGKIDIAEQPIINTPEARETLEDAIMRKISEYGGSMPISDKSSPDLIHKHFGVSKAAFKRALGNLYKDRKVIIKPDQVIKNL